ncbi:MAG: hydantoinase/oxoprolinase family protein [Gemmataceae bacterium]
MKSVIGLDIGGANLKAAHTSGVARLQPFELWKNPSGLADSVRALLATLPPADFLAVTMTGELCDCFETKRQGVSSILEAVAQAAGATPVQVWRNDGQFVSLSSAPLDPLPIAAANWLALATFVGRYAAGSAALLIDIGSTTTDIVPLRDGCPVPVGHTDRDRLRSGELVYTGVHRTPVCAVLGSLGAAELFATMHDVYLLLNAVPEDPRDRQTADGRPATKAHAHARLARMVCADAETLSLEETVKLAQKVALRQTRTIGWAIERVLERRLPNRPEMVIVSGSGEFLALPLLTEQPNLSRCKRKRLSQLLCEEVSRAACAYAVAVLASEQNL